MRPPTFCLPFSSITSGCSILATENAFYRVSFGSLLTSIQTRHRGSSIPPPNVPSSGFGDALHHRTAFYTPRWTIPIADKSHLSPSFHSTMRLLLTPPECTQRRKDQGTHNLLWAHHTKLNLLDLAHRRRRIRERDR